MPRSAAGTNTLQLFNSLKEAVAEQIRPQIEKKVKADLKAQFGSFFGTGATRAPRAPGAPRMGRPPKVKDGRSGPRRIRTKEEVDKQAESLLSLIKRSPKGLKIAEAAKTMGLKSLDLALPAAKLKKQKLVKTKGARALMVYYPA